MTIFNSETDGNQSAVEVLTGPVVLQISQPNGTIVTVKTKVKGDAVFQTYVTHNASDFPFVKVEGMSHLQIEISGNAYTPVKVWMEAL